EERVISVAREEWFEEERYPTMASVEQALVGKYGTPTTRADAPTVVELTWAYDPQGRPVRPGSNLSRQCRAQPNPDGATRFSTDCGLAISATIYRLRSNPALSERIGVGVMDQARGYEAITGTERKLQQLAAQRRAREVEEAAKKAAGPQL